MSCFMSLPVGMHVSFPAIVRKSLSPLILCVRFSGSNFICPWSCSSNHVLSFFILSRIGSRRFFISSKVDVAIIFGKFPPPIRDMPALIFGVEEFISFSKPIKDSAIIPPMLAPRIAVCSDIFSFV